MYLLYLDYEENKYEGKVKKPIGDTSYFSNLLSGADSR